jgi:hypothetical protein
MGNGQFFGLKRLGCASFRVIEKLGIKFVRKTVINGVEAIHYVMSRDDYKIHLELDSKLDVE